MGISSENTRPVLTRYTGEHLAKVALPLGGIGTGTVSLGGRGDLRDFEIVNRPAKGFTPGNAFFALWLQTPDGNTVTRCLEGPLDFALYEGNSGSIAPNHGLPRFREATFEAAYPFGQITLTDADVPLHVTLQAFNPLIPTDSERSGIPVAVLRYELQNPNDFPVTASVCGSLPNFIGNDGKNRLAKDNRCEYRAEDGLSGVFLFSEGVASDAESFGTMSLSVLTSDEEEGLVPLRPRTENVSHRTAWPRKTWNGGLLHFWDDFSTDGAFSPVDDGDPMAALAVRLTLAPGETRAVTFLLTWHFPNRPAWHGVEAIVGNYYTTQYADAWDVARKTAPQLPQLEADTLAFVQAFVESDLPAVLKEAALYNVSTLRTQTTFRTPDGRLFGWEGCNNDHGCCHGSCTHVWNYEVTTPFLFGELARTMREVEFGFTTNARGLMAFRAPLPLTDESRPWNLAAADGQMGCLMKLYREWQLSGDDTFLKKFWPRAKRALEFCWIPDGWDADKDGVMEGCQHNTMDVEYYGPNPQMGTWYLGALRACEEMANHLGETEFAAECRRLFENGSAWLDAHLFNGEYYEHQIVPPASGKIADGLRHESMGSQQFEEPILQLGAGCLIDQLVGQYMAHICGLGYLLKPDNIAATLQSLMRYNFQESMHAHFNHFRSYALGNESAMLMATYPLGRRPEQPFPYNNEVMTGFEYTAAIHMLYEGQTDDGLKVISAIRARYDGRKRSPFDEAECGHHYARAMAAWAGVLAWTGFHYNGLTYTLRFARPTEATTCFWSNGFAWGTCTLTPTESGLEMALRVLYGSLRVQTVQVGEQTVTLGDAVQTLTAGQTRTIALPALD